MKTLELKTNVVYKVVGDSRVTLITTESRQFRFKVTDYYDGDASAEDIAEISLAQADTIKTIANIFCSKQ